MQLRIADVGMDRIGQNIMLAKLLYLVIALLNQAIIVSEFEKQITIVSISILHITEHSLFYNSSLKNPDYPL